MLRLTITCLAFLLFPTICSADIISIAVSGPGGTGHGGVDPSSFTTGLLAIDFTALKPVTVTVDVDNLNSQSGYLVGTTSSPWLIRNDTGYAWTSFLIEGGPELNGLGTGQRLGNSIVSYLGSNTEIWSYGQSVNLGQNLDYRFGFQSPTAGSYAFTLTPNAPQPSSDPVSTPEPSSLVMLVSGIVAIATYRFFTR